MTPQELSSILPNCKDPEGWAEALNETLPKFDINEPLDVAMFLSQVGHESAQLNVLEENLNYSSNALMKVFGKYFKDEATAQEYARKPSKIASRVYANRMGNGDEESQEGWLYRGRGILQITGKNNYTECSLFLFDDTSVLIDDPDILLQPNYAIGSACWYWTRNKLLGLTDVKRATRIVNGGTHGLDDRIAIYDRATSYLA